MLQKYQVYVEEIDRLIVSLENELVPLVGIMAKLTGMKEESIKEEVSDARLALTENRRVRLAVMGQVKSGKSTLLNALLFDGRPYLPTAATPKTARLTVISASREGEPPGAVIHFYSHEDWEDIRKQADMEMKAKGEPSGYSVKSIYADIVSAAERKLGSKIESLLGTTRSVSLSELSDYVAEDGQFTDLVKYTELHYLDMPYDDLEVVDTPGLNDPVRSREKQTIDYLQKADAVLFLSPPDRFLDREDMQFAFRDMIQAGIQEVMVVVPQVDKLNAKQKNEFLRNCLDGMSKRASRFAEESGFGPMAQDLAYKLFVPENSIMVSAMAYILAMRLKRGETLSEDELWYLRELLPRHDWPVEDPEQLIAASKISELGVKIERRIVARKGEILIRGPLNKLSASINELAAQNERRLRETQEDLQKVAKDIEQRKREREAELQDFNLFKAEVEMRLELFKREVIQEGVRSAARLPVPQVIATPWSDGRKNKECEYLAEEISISAREVLEEQSRELLEKYRRLLSEIEESLHDLMPSLSSQASLMQEVNALLSSLVKRLEAALENTKIRVRVSFSYSFWNKVFGRAEAIARNDVARACHRAEEEIRQALREMDEQCKVHLSEGIEQLRGKLQSLRAEKQRKLDELERGIVEGEVNCAQLEKKYREQLSLYEDLKKLIDKVGPWFDELKRKMGGGVGCSSV